MARAFHRLIPRKQVIWFTDLTEIDSDGFFMPDNLKIQRFDSIEEIDSKDLKKLTECGTELMGSAGSNLIRERFKKGAVLCLYKENDKLAGYCWTIVKKHIRPPYLPHTETDVHFFGTEIFPGFRGGYLFRLFDEGTKIIYKKEGVKRYYSETYLYNKRALKAIFKTSARKIGIATRFSIFGKNVVIWHDMTSKANFL